MSLPLEQLLACTWVGADGGVWNFSVGEGQPLLDLDADEEDDPVITTLLEEPRVSRAYHEDLCWTAPRSPLRSAWRTPRRSSFARWLAATRPWPPTPVLCRDPPLMPAQRRRRGEPAR